MSMNIYSIPECSTDEETFDDDETTGNAIVTDEKLRREPSYISLIGDESNTSRVGFSSEEVYTTLDENSLKASFLLGKTANKLSTSLIDISKCKRNSDNGSIEVDKMILFANATSCDVNIERISSPYLKIEDCSSNSTEKSPIEETFIEENLLSPSLKGNSFNSTSETNLNLKLPVSDYGSSDPTHADLKRNIGISASTSDLSSNERKQTHGLGIAAPQPSPRNRSGSLQWVQNILQNIDQKYRDLLDIRRPSDIADDHIRKSNEELEMEHSDDDSSKTGQNMGAGSRRYSENVIGKQRRFPFSSGIGHLKELWRERNVHKRQEVKDYDQLRPDVCPLFNFPRKYDEDEVILDTCTVFAWCFHCLLRSSVSEEVVINNSSQEHILPTPLILHLNQSTAQLLIREANSMFVSNTSLSDLVNDNATQQMLLRYRERKRQVRLLSIQRDILQKLGLTRGPNVTARLSAEERQSLVRSFDRTMIERTESSENNETTPCTETNDPS